MKGKLRIEKKVSKLRKNEGNGENWEKLWKIRGTKGNEKNDL